MNNFEKIIKELINNINDITDIEYNSKHIYISDNKKGKYILNQEINKEDANNYIKQLANENNKEFNNSNPILKLTINNLRICAIHESVSRKGLTIHIRITSPIIKISDKDKSFAPTEIMDFLEIMIKSKCNILICGKSGVGKTELQKYLVKFIEDSDKIILIDDLDDTHISEIYNNKNIFSWNINESIDYKDLIEIALINNPEWILIPEVKGRESYQLLKCLMSGHKTITTFHSDDIKNTIDRFSFLINENYSIDENLINKIISDNIDIIVFMEKINTPNGIIRRISKIVELEYDDELVNYRNIFKIKTKVDDDFNYKEEYVFKEISDRLLKKIIITRNLNKDIARKLNVI